MSGKYEYAVVQLTDSARDERLNTAVAIFSEDGIDIRVPRRLDKLRALSAALDPDKLRALLKQLQELDALSRKQGRVETTSRVEMLNALSPLHFSNPLPFVALTATNYEEWASKLLRNLVEPEPTRLKLTRKRTKLVNILRSAFRSERVLARKGEDITAHRVVPNYQIAEGLLADFVLRNGSMHVVETVDASSEDIPARKVVADIAVSALVLEQARMTFGESATESRLVYEASAAVERIAMPSLEAAAHQGTKLINWASIDDRNKLITQLSSLATPLEKKGGSLHDTRFHASVQHKLNLN